MPPMTNNKGPSFFLFCLAAVTAWNVGYATLRFTEGRTGSASMFVGIGTFSFLWFIVELIRVNR